LFVIFKRKMFLFCLYLSSALALEKSRPLMFWTNAQGESNHVFDDSTFKVRNIMTRADPQKSMLTFAFLFNDLDFQKIQNMKGRITSDDSKTSIFMPFVTGSFKLSSAHVGTRASSWSDFLNKDTSNTNVVVFEPKDDQEFNQLLQKAQGYADKNKERQVGFLVTAAKPRELPEPQSPYQGVVFTEFLSQTNVTTQFTGPQSVTPFTFQALIVVALVFFGTCIGNTCMSEIQVPITYIHTELPIRKEY